MYYVAAKRPDMGCKLQEFQKVVRQLARLTMQPEDSKLFKSSSGKLPRLIGCGIESHMAMINCRIVQTPEMVKQSAEEIIRPQYYEKCRVRQEFLKGKVELPVESSALGEG